MSCSVYLIKSIAGQNYYTGISIDPRHRLDKHNSGKLKTTSKNKPYLLVYTKEYPDYKSARKHEIWLKKKNRKYKARLAQLAPPCLPRLFQAG